MCHLECLGNLKDDDRYPIITGQLHGDMLVSVTLASLQWFESVMRVGSKHSSCLAHWGNADHRVADMLCLCSYMVFFSNIKLRSHAVLTCNSCPHRRMKQDISYRHTYSLVAIM